MLIALKCVVGCAVYTAYTVLFTKRLSNIRSFFTILCAIDLPNPYHQRPTSNHSCAT